MTRPQVSVLIPTHRRPQLLADAIASVAAQDYPRDSIEVVVVHDGEPVDREPPASMGLRLHYRIIPKAGLSAAVNAAFALAAGRYITVLADDDWMYPHKLRVLAEALGLYGDAGAVFALGAHIPADPEEMVIVPPRSVTWLMNNPVVNWATVCRNRGLRIHGTAIMYRRSLWEQYGPWDVTLPTAEEWEFHLRLLYRGETFRAVHSVTDAYRIHADQKSGRKLRRSQRRIDTLARINAMYPVTL